MSKQPVPPKGNKAKNLGYTSFSEESIAQADANTGVNQRSYDLLLQMLDVPEKARKKAAKGKNAKDHDYYPTSKAETLRMEELLDEAYAALEDPSDKELVDALGEMRGIIDWSKTRQWNFHWSYIVGVLLFVCFLWYQASQQKDDVNRARMELAEIRSATDSMLTLYKTQQLGALSSSIESNKSRIADYTARLDTVTNRDRKKDYERSIKNYNKSLKEYEKEFAALQSAKIADVKKMAEKEYKKRLSSRKASHRGMVLWTIFFILLIPLYIIAERPYGYTISKYRLESKLLGWIRKAMFWLSGGLLAGAAAIQVTEYVTTTTYSDGSTSKSTSSDGIPVLAMKVVLIIIAACIFVFTSVAIMLYSTIVGLHRNYDLKVELKKLIPAAK